MSLDKPSLEDLRIEREPARGRGFPVNLALGACAIALVVVAFFWWRSRAGAVEVQTALVREGASGAARTVLNASGYVTARRQATVSSKITGKVIEVLIEEGMKVKEGQVLARLDDSNTRTGLDVAQAQLESAQTSLQETEALLKQAQNEFNRVTELSKQNITSQSDLDKAESDAVSLQGRLARQERDVTVAERQVAQWQQQMEDTIIRAPFAGVITTKDAQPGEMISPISAGGGFTRTGIGTVVDMDSLEIEIDVNESYINRGDSFQSVYAKLDSAAAFDRFKDSLTTNPQLSVKVERQSEYYEEQSQRITQLITTLGYLIAFLMALGAVFGALNTMYSAVSARTREIATLRALGFGGGAVVVSLMLESLALAFAGGAIGGGLAYAAFNNFHTSTMNWQSFSQVTFAFRVTPMLLAQGIIWASCIGLVGGVFPAVRAVRMPIAAALREL